MIIIFLISIIVVITFLVFYYYQHRNKLIKYLQSKWGKEIFKEYSYNDFDNIRSYYELKKEVNLTHSSKGYIDELTWNDLDMDQVFVEINNTESIIGASYLYDLLHCVHFDIAELKQFDELVNWIDQNEGTRLKIQLLLDKFGKAHWNRIPEYLFKIDEKKSYYKPIYSIMGVFPIVCLFALFINMKIGLILVCCSVALNAHIHYKSSNKITAEMDTLNTIYLLLKTAKNISTIDNEVKPIFNILRENCSKLNRILSLEGRLFLSANTDLGIIQEYLGIITLSSLRIHHKFLKLIKKETKALQSTYENLGKLETSIAVASYRRSIAYWSTPEFVDNNSVEVADLYHPLINNPISNTIQLNKNVIITGSNASGKSTFVKSLAINGILAQSIYTVLATKFIAPLSYYMTSMAISDSIITSESYYIAEIRSLKRILDSINRYPFCICFIDEILKGTNTVERIAASSAILKHLSSLNCLCLIASHDIELTQILSNLYDNYHFRETILDSQISFDYKIYKGPSTTRNAIKLLEVMNYNRNIINDANHLVEHFSNNKVWINP